jgi:hypothetical protein
VRARLSLLALGVGPGVKVTFYEEALGVIGAEGGDRRGRGGAGRAPRGVAVAARVASRLPPIPRGASATVSPALAVLRPRGAL